MKARRALYLILPIAALPAFMSACATGKADALSGASYSPPRGSRGTAASARSGASASELLVVFAGRHSGSTFKIAAAVSEELGAALVGLDEAGAASASPIGERRMVGFGSGIFHGKNDESLIEFVEALPPCQGTRAFIYSTCGAPADIVKEDRRREAMRKNHLALRNALEAQGFAVVGEFSCPGYNDNSFLRLFGGMNRGRPDSNDLDEARRFAADLLADS